MKSATLGMLVKLCLIIIYGIIKYWSYVQMLAWAYITNRKKKRSYLVPGSDERSGTKENKSRFKIFKRQL